MQTNSTVKKDSFICPECFMPASISEKDKAYNLARLQEQSEFRKPDEPFNFRFKCTCKKCGSITIEKIIKNVKMRRS